MFIDNTYFRCKAALPDAAWVKDNLQFYIESYEEQLLRSLLGGVLYADLVLHKTDASGKWYDFINGCTYNVDYNGTTIPVKWIGLKNTAKKGMIAPYVFCAIIRDNRYLVTGTGIMEPGVESGIKTGFNEKLVAAWNEMCYYYGSTEDDKLAGSAFSFLKYHPEHEFSDWFFTPIERMNVYGI